MKPSLILALLILMTQISVASAGLLIEPVLGYSVAQELDIDGGDKYTGGRGVSYGGRVGFQKLGFQLGLDYLQSSIDMDDKDFDNNVDTKEWAAFVGFEFPVFFRVYGGYIFKADADSTSNGVDLDFMDGKGLKAGLGLTFLPFVDINLEMRQGSYDKIKGLGDEDGSDFRAYMIALSVPLNL